MLSDILWVPSGTVCVTLQVVCDSMRDPTAFLRDPSRFSMRDPTAFLRDPSRFFVRDPTSFLRDPTCVTLRVSRVTVQFSVCFPGINEGSHANL